MATAVFVLAIVTTIGAVVTLVIFVRGARAIPVLANQPARPTGPLVSVIFAAKDEGPNMMVGTIQLRTHTAVVSVEAITEGASPDIPLQAGDQIFVHDRLF